MAKEKRLKKVYSQGGMAEQPEIWVDTETGVNYLYHMCGYSGGMTLLLNQDGKLVTTKREA